MADPVRTSPSPGLVATLSAILFISYLFIANTSSPHIHTNPHKAVAILSGEFNVTGRLVFHQETPSGPVHITGHVAGLDPNSRRGMHVHTLGDISNGCLSTGAHYNPFDTMHGGPEDSERHVGDLGNIQSDSKGYAIIDMNDSLLSLHSPYSIVGRSIVVHTGTDDLGRGDYDDSKLTGHAGDRAACGIIGMA